MAIATYSELVTAVASHLHRTDLSSVIPDFITLAETEMNTRLRLNCQLTVADLTCSSRYTALPSNLLELRTVEYNGQPLVLVPYATPEYMALAAQENDSGSPRRYSVIGMNIEVYPVPSSVTLTLIYYAQIGPLTSNTPTTTILTKYPDIYFYGTMRQAALYTRDAALGAAMTSAFNAAIVQAQQAGEWAKYPGTLQIRAA